MNWWALESHADAWTQIESMLTEPTIWRLPMFDQHIAGRLMQRYAAAGTQHDLQHCARLLELAPSDESRGRLMVGLNRAFQGQAMPPLPESLAAALDHYQSKIGDSGLIIGVRQKKDESVDQAIAALQKPSTDLLLQIEIAKTFGEVNLPKVVPTLIKLATGRGTSEPVLQRVAIQSLTQYSDDSIPTSLVGSMNSSISAEHGLAIDRLSNTGQPTSVGQGAADRIE